MNKKTIKDFDLKGKKVIIRVDFNVPIKNGVVTSDKRIKAALPTIKYAIEKGAKIILLSHLGRIKRKDDLIKLSLKPVAQNLSNKLNINVKFSTKTRSNLLKKSVSELQEGEILMIENTRFEDLYAKKESQNNKELGKYWADLGDIFINDAFGTAHRKHASNVGIASNITESGIGLLIEKELKMLNKVLVNPKSPFIAIIGGAKVSDKISVIKNLLDKADKILIGGGMAYTFLKAQGYSIGNSLVETEYLNMAKNFLVKAENKIVLPVDHAVSKSYSNNERIITDGIEIGEGFMALDLGPKSIQIYKNELKNAKMVVWNGPMGVAEFDNFKNGTVAVANAIAKQENILSIIGGGDSAAAVIKLGFENKFTHISTGGGASLSYLEGDTLPGIEAVQNK
ncbi:MAG: phosphoglycerate kinase [Mollicutes bacterium PWAP]|nr:phosphoglycerate kinase [Mollicutes bacterium PWAP]